jgi:hypothetical protein
MNEGKKVAPHPLEDRVLSRMLAKPPDPKVAAKKKPSKKKSAKSP